MIFSADVCLTYNDKSINILVSYKNDQVLLSYENISVSLTKEEIKNLINYINEKFDLNVSLDQSIQIDLLSIINTLRFSVESNKINLSIDLSSINESIGVLSLSLTNTENGIVINLNDQTFDSVNISNIELTISDNYKEIIVNEQTNNLDYDSIITIIDLLVENKDIIKSGLLHIETKFNIVVKDIEINVVLNLNIDIKDKEFNAHLNLTVLSTSHDIYITYKNGNLLASYGNMLISLTNDEIKELIDYVNETFDLNLGNDIDTSNLSLENIIKSLELNINNDTINISLLLSNLINGFSDLNIEIISQTKGTQISACDIEINGIKVNNINCILNSNYKNFNLSGNTINYEGIKNIIDFISDILNTAKKEKFNISFSTDIYTNNVLRFNVNANLYIIVKENGSINLKASLDIIAATSDDHDYTIDFSLIDDYIYASVKFARRDDTEHDFLNLKMALKDALSVLGTASSILNLNIPFLDKFSSIDSLNKDSLGALVSNKELLAINFSEYLNSISSSSNTLKIALSGQKLFKSDEDLEIIFKKDASSSYNKLEINNIYSKNNETVERFNVLMTLNDSDFEINLDNKEYIDISSINSLVEAFLNTAMLDDFHITGSFKVNMKVVGITINETIKYEVIVKLYDKVPTIIVKFYDIPVIVGVNNDVPYSGGDTDGGKNRNLTYYISGGNVYMYREEKVSRFLSSDQTYEKKLMTSTDAFLSDIYYYLLQAGFGFSTSIINSIKSGVGSSNHTIDLAKLLKNYSYNEDDNLYSLTLSLAELTGNNELKDLTLNIGTTELNGKKYLSKLQLNLDIEVSVLSLAINTSDTELVDILGTVSVDEANTYIDNYNYKMDELYTARNGSWQKESEVVYSINYNFNQTEYESISQTYKYNDLIDYPSFNKLLVIDGKYYKFIAWYYNESLDDEYLFDYTNMPRGNYELYAKWEEVNLDFKVYVDDQLTIVDFNAYIGSDYYVLSDATYYAVYKNDTYKNILNPYIDLYHIVDDYILFDVRIYTNKPSDSYEITLNLKNEYIGANPYKFYVNNGTSISAIPYYSYGNFEVNAWFTSSSLDIDTLITDYTSISSDITLYPYYSTKTTLLNSKDNSLLGFSSDAVTTLIIPLFINGQKITTISNSAFYNTSIQTVVFSEFITTLETDSFKSTALTKIYLSDSITYVAINSFYMESNDRRNQMTFYANNSSIDLSSLYAYKYKSGFVTKYKNYSNNKTSYNLSEVIETLV